MERIQLLLLGFPIFLFCSDIANLFTPPPPSPPPPPRTPPPRHLPSQSITNPPDFAAAAQINPLIGGGAAAAGGLGYGTTVEFKFCVSCSYRGNAETMKKMLETSFPGIDIILGNYPPQLPKRLLSKLVPVAQVGITGIIMAGDQIFPRLGMAPPPWYFSLRANRFGSIAMTWLMGNFVQSYLQSTGAFEVYCNGDLVFSKLKEHRFPGEFELKKLIGDRLPDSAFGQNLGKVWS